MKRMRKTRTFKLVAVFVALSLFSGWDWQALVANNDAASSFADTGHPIITGLTPASGAAGTYVTIQGAGFSRTPSENIVRFGAVQSSHVSVISENQLRARVPQGLTPGFTSVTVRVNTETSNAALFDLLGEAVGHIFVDETQDRLPLDMAISESSVLKQGDLNGDKYPELLIIDKTGNHFYLLLNDTTGFFTDASRNLPFIGNVTSVTALALGDVNGDSRPDIILANAEGQSVKLLMNSGNAVFTDVTSLKLPLVSGNAGSVDLGDADGDGDLDIIIAKRDSKDILLLNDGAGNFTKDARFNLPLVIDASSCIRFFDADADGDLDIFTANNDIIGSSTLRNRIYINGGDGLFIDDTEALIPNVLEYAESFDSGDIDSDRDLDIAIANYTQNTLFLNNGIGQMTDVTTQPDRIPANYFASNDAEFGDIDGDGDLDLLFVGDAESSLFVNDGLGYFSEDVSLKLPDYESIPASTGGKAAEFADIDGDGDLDIIIGGEKFYILFNKADYLPVVNYWTPGELENLRLLPGQILQFGIQADNPIHGEPLTFRWYFNGRLVPTVNDATSSMLLIIPRIGANTIKVEVANSVGAVSLEWNLAVDSGVNSPPVLTNPIPFQEHIFIDLAPGAAIAFSITATDPEGDPLSYAWKLGAQVISTNATLDAVAYAGRLTVGNYTLTVEVNDGHHTIPVTHRWFLHVTEGTVNLRPVAADDTQTTVEGAPVDINVLENDTDPNGDEIELLGVTQPANGQAAIINNNTQIRYTPNPNFTGQDSFTYRITDGALESFSATVTVIVQQGPTALFLEDLAERSFFYFRDEMNLANGLIRDKAKVDGSDGPDDDHSSIAACGFGLTALAIGAERGWIERTEAENRVSTMLDTFIDIQSRQAGDLSGRYGRNGFFYHFLDIETAERVETCEVSTIDTAILIAGALTAGEYFGGEVRTKASTLYSNVDWPAFLDARNNQFYMSWSPESGFSREHWDYYSESLMLYLLAIGSPAHPVDRGVMYSFRRVLGKYGDGLPLVQSWFGSLFTYQYSHAWFDFRNKHDAQNVNWFRNSINATLANKEYCVDNSAAYGYGANFWGLTASDGKSGYREYGARPLGSGVPISDGTVAPSASAGSIAIAPDIAIPALLNIYNTYGQSAWDRYGFIDSLNLKPGEIPWYSSYYIGIDVGISLLMVENYRTGFVWNYFMQNSRVRNAMTLAGFTSDPEFTYIDEEPYNGFVSVLLKESEPSQEIIYNIDTVTQGEYLLAFHPFGMDNDGRGFVDMEISVNGVSQGTVRFNDPEGEGSRNVPNIYKFIQSAALREGENNITLTRRAGEAWLSLKNIEIKPPRTPQDTWMIGEDDGRYTEFGDEWLIDDTYYAGDPTNTFEKALNINNEAFTDILFYADDLTFNRELVLNSLDANGNVSLGVLVNGSVVEPGFMMGARETHTTLVPATVLHIGWNWVRLAHVGQAGSGLWITWDWLEFNAAPITLVPPANLAAAAFGPNTVNLRWDASLFAGRDGYNIYRSGTHGGPYTKLNTSLISTSYTDEGLSDRTAYYYVVTAVDVGGAPDESDYSAEVAVTTGDYELDFRDGKEPNAFGGISSAHFSYERQARFDWIDGPVRKVTLNAGQEAWIGLNGKNISGATKLSMWIKGTGTEVIEIGLEDTSSQKSTVPVTCAFGWQNLQIALSEFPNPSLNSAHRLSVKSVSSAMTLYIDDIVFVRDAPTGYTLEVTPKNVSGNNANARATGVSFGDATGRQYAAANQYMEIKYASGDTNWKLWIYSRNKEKVDPEFVEYQYNGLVSSEGKHRIPLIWRVYPTVQAGGVSCDNYNDVYNNNGTPDNRNDDLLTWNYVKDRDDEDIPGTPIDESWAFANQPRQEYSVICFGRVNEWAWIAGVPPGLGDRAPSGNAFCLYLGGFIKDGSPGEYSANIYFDLTHE